MSPKKQTPDTKKHNLDFRTCTKFLKIAFIYQYDGRYLAIIERGWIHFVVVFMDMAGDSDSDLSTAIFRQRFFAAAIRLPSSAAAKDRCQNNLPIHRPMALWCYPTCRRFGKDQANIKAATSQSRLQTIENFEQFVPATESPGKGWPATVWHSVQNQLHQLQFCVLRSDWTVT